MMHVSEMVKGCHGHGHDVVISIGGIFFYRTLCMLHDEEKLSIQ